MATDLEITDLETAPPPPFEEGDSVWTVGTGGAVVLHGISWKIYRRLRKMRANYHIRMTYDRGEMEIMSPSPLHEKIVRLLGDLISVWRIEVRIPIASCGKMTISRAALKRGFEPDHCYYVQHEPQMWDKTKINFKVDPPPDLAIEVEVTRKLGKKAEIYAAFRVPELWCWRENSLKVFELSPEGTYVPRATSVCFPTFPIAKVQEVVRQLGTVHETDLILSFRDWVRQNAQPAS